MSTVAELAEKVSGISEKLSSHLQVAAMVDNNNGEEIKRLFKKYNDLQAELAELKTDVALLKGAQTIKKDYFGTIAKWILVICGIIGTMIMVVKYGASIN